MQTQRPRTRLCELMHQVWAARDGCAPHVRFMTVILASWLYRYYLLMYRMARQGHPWAQKEYDLMLKKNNRCAWGI